MSDDVIRVREGMSGRVITKSCSGRGAVRGGVISQSWRVRGGISGDELVTFVE